MVHAMKYLRSEVPAFEIDTYDTEAVAPWENEIRRILIKRQPDACGDWKKLGERLSGQELEDFDLEKYQPEYLDAAKADRDSTFLGAFFVAAMAQKSMVTNRIFQSGSLLAGFSVDYAKQGFRGIRDYRMLVEKMREEMEK